MLTLLLPVYCDPRLGPCIKCHCSDTSTGNFHLHLGVDAMSHSLSSIQENQVLAVDQLCIP